MTKTTQQIHRLRIAEPLNAYYNLQTEEASIVGIKGDKQAEIVIPFEYLISTAVTLTKIWEIWQKWQLERNATIRSEPADDIEAEWLEVNRLLAQRRDSDHR